MTLWIILYIIIGIISYMEWLVWFRSKTWVDFEDLFLGFLVLFVFWPIGVPLVVSVRLGLAYKFLQLINKKR